MVKEIPAQVRKNFPLGAIRDGLVNSLPAEYLSIHASFNKVRQGDVCKICGCVIDVHPQCGRILNADNTPFLYVLCDQSRVVEE